MKYWGSFLGQEVGSSGDPLSESSGMDRLHKNSRRLYVHSPTEEEGGLACNISFQPGQEFTLSDSIGQDRPIQISWRSRGRKELEPKGRTRIKKYDPTDGDHHKDFQFTISKTKPNNIKAVYYKGRNHILIEIQEMNNIRRGGPSRQIIDTYKTWMEGNGREGA